MDFSALDLTYDVCIISLLMLIAKLVRIRMRPLQNLFIPTALIAGFFGVLLGFLVVWAYFMLVSRRLFCDHWVERGIYIWGWCTGVMSIAVLLLRIVDPEFKTGVLEDSGLAWIFVSFVDLALVTFLPILVAGGLGLTSGAVLILAGLALLGVCALRYGVRDKAGKVVFPASKRGE